MEPSRALLLVACLAAVDSTNHKSVNPEFCGIFCGRKGIGLATKTDLKNVDWRILCWLCTKKATTTTTTIPVTVTGVATTTVTPTGTTTSPPTNGTTPSSNMTTTPETTSTTPPTTTTVPTPAPT